MTRRTLFAGLLGAGLLKAVAPDGIIDAHVHFYDPTRPEGLPWPASKSDVLYRPMLPGPWREMVAPLGVTGVIVVEASPWLDDNQWVLELARRNPVIVGTVGHLDPGTPGFGQHLTRFARNPLFRGIRLGQNPLHAALNDPAARADLKLVADANLTVDILGAGPVLLDVARLANAFPEMRIVVDHLPFESPAGSLQALHSNQNVFAKVSGVVRRVNDRVSDTADFYRKALDEVWDVFGPDRVIYASNWPVCERMAPYAMVLKVVREYFDEKGPAIANKYFRLNSKAAYRWS